MNTSHTVAYAWLRLRRRSLIALPVRVPMPPPADPDANDGSDALDAISGDQEVRFDSSLTLPMLYRSEAFAEDLFDSHPQLI